MNLFTHLLIGLSVGFSILYANAYGAEDYPWLRKSLFTTGVIGAGVTLALSGGGLLFPPAHPDPDPDPGGATGGLCPAT